MAVTEQVQEFLRQSNLAYSVFPHAPAYTAQEEAAITHIPGRDWAKPVVFFADGEPIQAVVSADRRFVRLTMVPFFNRIGDVDTFTFVGETTTDSGTTTKDTTDDTKTVKDKAVTTTSGTTVQLPTFAFTTVTTTVSVPDGGTVLLGGIKRLREQRSERGVPLLSKVPWVNRLFKNVGIGRDAQSLMMMVTPRIIIQEEEEAKLGIEIEP